MLVPDGWVEYVIEHDEALDLWLDHSNGVCGGPNYCPHCREDAARKAKGERT